jgi:hypothetical protein
VQTQRDNRMNNFFYDLNKRLSALADKQDAKQITEDARATAPKSRLAESMEVAEAGYSAKAGRAGKDLGKPGKNFSKIAKSAGEKYGSKAAGERVAGAVLNKLRHPANEGTCPGCNCSPCECVEEGNAFTGKLKATPKGEKFKLGDKEFKDTSEIEEGFEEMDAWLASREKEKGTGKFDRKERTLPGGMKATTYTRKHEDDEADKDGDEVKSDAPKKKGRPKGKDKGPERVTKGAWKHKGKRKEKADEALDSDGVMMTRPTNCSMENIEHGEQAEYNDEAGMAKDSLHTIVRSAKELEHALRSNENLPEWVQEKIGQIKGMMSSVTDYIISTHERDVEQATGEEGISVVPEGWRGGLSGERPLVKKRRTGAETAYSEIVDLLKSPQNGIDPYVRQHLMKLVNELARQATKTKEMPVAEKAPPGAKAERMVKGIKKSLSKDGHLSGKDKAIAYATTWKARKAGKVEEESTNKEDNRAEKAGRKVAKDIEHDEGHNGRDDNRAEKAGMKVTKDIEYDDKKDKDWTPERKAAAKKKGEWGPKVKEEKVDETTVAGSVATASLSGKSSKGGMQFGKGVYEGFNNQVESMITETMNVSVNMNAGEDGQNRKSITVSADGDDADMLAQLLKAAGLSGQSSGCGCGNTPCSCETVDEAYGDTDETLNSPDWPTDTEKLDAEPNLRTYSGGLNGPKSTGQSTTPVLASQLRRQASMEESVELERNLFKTWKNYKG